MKQLEREIYRQKGHLHELIFVGKIYRGIAVFLIRTIFCTVLFYTLKIVIRIFLRHMMFRLKIDGRDPLINGAILF